METKVGIARMDITPLKPLPLQGFQHRKGLPDNGISERTNRPLYLNVWLFEQTDIRGKGPAQFVLVQADFICWPSERLEDVHSAIRHVLSNADAMIILNASHTHSGPQTDLRYTTPNRQNVIDYTDYVIENVKEAVKIARSNLEQVRLFRGSGTCGFSVYRRKQIDGQIAMVPNEDISIDQEVTVLTMMTDSGAVKGVLFHYTCHPTTTDDHAYSSEYPGAAVQRIEQQWGGRLNATFLQGCTGDVKPNIQRDGKFYHGSEEEVNRFGFELADEVLRIMKEPMEEVVWEPFECEVQYVDLPFQHVPHTAELKLHIERGGRMGAWAQEMLNHPERLRPSIPMRLTLAHLGDKVSLLAFNAEIVQAYGQYVRQHTQRRAIPLGYSDGMIGYVPTAAQVGEGGYEAAGAYVGRLLPSPYKRELEERIKSAIDQLWRRDSNES